MYTRDLWASLLRRWPLLLACLLGTAGLVYFVSQQVAPTYESTADVVLVPPKSVIDPTANRYLDLGGLRQAVDVLTRSLTSDETINDIKKQTPGGTFEVTPDGTTSAPILLITVKAGTSGEAQRTLDAVLERVPVNLGRLQQSLDISEKSLITPQTVSSDQVPEVVNKKRIRAIGAVAAMALLASAMLIAGVDNLFLRRATGRAGAVQEEQDEQDVPVGPVRTSVQSDPRMPRPAPAPRETRKRHVVPADVRR